MAFVVSSARMMSLKGGELGEGTPSLWSCLRSAKFAFYHIQERTPARQGQHTANRLMCCSSSFLYSRGQAAGLQDAFSIKRSRADSCYLIDVIVGIEVISKDNPKG